MRPELEREGLTAPMFTTLTQIVSEGPMNVGQIATACLVTSANISTAVDDLVQRGLAERESPGHDRRVVVIRATRRGRAVQRVVWDRLARRAQVTLHGASRSDLEAAIRVLRRFAHDGPDAPVPQEVPAA